VDVTTVVDDLNARQDTPYTLVGRFAGGAGTGAFELRDPHGGSWVLKAAEPGALDFDRAARTTAVLRRRGYPAPETVARGSVDGITYAVAERLPGAPLTGLDEAHVPAVLRLVDLQAGAGLDDAPPWVDALVSTVLEGRVGYCEVATLRRELPALLDHVQQIAAGSAGLTVPTDDVVHYDFAPPNVLAVDGVISGVIDWEGSTTGDAAFDLVTQAFYAFDETVRDRFLAAACDRTEPDALRLYVAHLTLRQLDWSLRNDTRDVVDWYLGISTEMLRLVDAPF
jgi:aminoglycoside phosphotransferase